MFSLLKLGRPSPVSFHIVTLSAIDVDFKNKHPKEFYQIAGGQPQFFTFGGVIRIPFHCCTRSFFERYCATLLFLRNNLAVAWVQISTSLARPTMDPSHPIRFSLFQRYDFRHGLMLKMKAKTLTMDAKGDLKTSLEPL
jgi:hypothetical protein